MLSVGLGARISPLDERDVFYRAGAYSLPRTVELMPSLPSWEARSQGNTSSCVGQALARGTRLAHLTQRGIDVGELSALWAYWAARRLAGGEIADHGCFPRFAIKALQKGGCASEMAWPFLPQRVDEMPGTSAVRSAHDLRGPRKYYSIAPGNEAPRLIRAAVANGNPVVACWVVDDAFAKSNGPRYVTQMHGEPLGGHAMLVHGYEDAGIRVQNSWGAGWRYKGHCLIAWELAERITEAWVLDI